MTEVENIGSCPNTKGRTPDATEHVHALVQILASWDLWHFKDAVSLKFVNKQIHNLVVH
jgi:hypothetical protein